MAAAAAVAQPKSMSRPKHWSEEVEEAYRFQVAGYRDIKEYQHIKGQDPDRWQQNGYVKKLQRKQDKCFYYFDKRSECADKDVNKCKLYMY
ncbi:meiosis expressed gene 1 protein homolog [Amphiura filiformis]|uniref:meiosis expressed gene 1 protein homolog n=1 Tax=Amphiura filiformis TaxID=82378 RepID=UPI003B21BB3D